MRRTGHRQLSFVPADSPDGGGSDGPPDASERRAFLLQRAKRKRSARTVAWAADTSRLLEDVASEANLALALLNVVRNKGAPGIDGQTVEDAEADAPKLLLICAVRCWRDAIGPAMSAGSSSQSPEAGSGVWHPDARFILHLPQLRFGMIA